MTEHGSPEARAAGCLCQRGRMLDKGLEPGDDYWMRLIWVPDDCPLHGIAANLARIRGFKAEPAAAIDEKAPT